MAGFREFAAGEPLTSANVDDFLAKQAVMKFADAAARDAALGTTVVAPNALREGMVAYLDDDNEVQYFDGTAWEPVSEPPAGVGSNVVQTVKTDTFTTTSTAFVDITGYNVTITPSSATSKVLVVAYISLGAGDATVAAFGRLVRNSTDILVGDAAQNRTRVTLDEIAPNDRTSQTTVSFLDSPATTSATAYKIQIASNNGTSIFVNRSRTDTNTAGIPRTASSIIAIEVAA